MSRWTSIGLKLTGITDQVSELRYLSHPSPCSGVKRLDLSGILLNGQMLGCAKPDTEWFEE
jgi:hypothetical protein